MGARCPQLARDPGARKLFEREAKIDGLIESAFVVSVIDAGIDEPTQTPYLVMEFLVGEDLGERVERTGPCTARKVVGYLGQVARALDMAHAKGIVHRDLKPENLFLCASDEDGDRVKVLDFGLAKLLQTEVELSTQGGGTPLFMAPEQTRRGREIGPWTDIWALGLIAYALLVGRSYWQAETVAEFYGELLSSEPRDPPSVRAAQSGIVLPATFDAWFFRCVDNDPRMRFASAGEAIVALPSALSLAVAQRPPTVHEELAVKRHSEALPKTLAAPPARIDPSWHPGTLLATIPTTQPSPSPPSPTRVAGNVDQITVLKILVWIVIASAVLFGVIIVLGAIPKETTSSAPAESTIGSGLAATEAESNSRPESGSMVHIPGGEFLMGSFHGVELGGVWHCAMGRASRTSIRIRRTE